MTGPQGQTITTPSATPTSTIKSPSSLPIGYVVVGVGVVLALSDTQLAPVIVWLLGAACVYQLIKPGSGVISKVTNSNPIPTRKA